MEPFEIYGPELAAYLMLFFGFGMWVCWIFMKYGKR
jgi:hypothetical protein